jgi:hypothetical protein
MSTFLWFLLGIVYLVLIITFALTTFRKGHFVLFFVGFFLPFLRIIGALIAPTAGAEARSAA